MKMIFPMFATSLLLITDVYAYMVIETLWEKYKDISPGTMMFKHLEVHKTTIITDIVNDYQEPENAKNK